MRRARMTFIRQRRVGAFSSVTRLARTRGLLHTANRESRASGRWRWIGWGYVRHAAQRFEQECSRRRPSARSEKGSLAVVGHTLGVERAQQQRPCTRERGVGTGGLQLSQSSLSTEQAVRQARTCPHASWPAGWAATHMLQRLVQLFGSLFCPQCRRPNARRKTEALHTVSLSHLGQPCQRLGVRLELRLRDRARKRHCGCAHPLPGSRLVQRNDGSRG